MCVGGGGRGTSSDQSPCRTAVCLGPRTAQCLLSEWGHVVQVMGHSSGTPAHPQAFSPVWLLGQICKFSLSLRKWNALLYLCYHRGSFSDFFGSQLRQKENAQLRGSFRPSRRSGCSQNPVICFAKLCIHWMEMFVFHVSLYVSEDKWLKNNFRAFVFRSSPPTWFYQAASLPAF